MSAARTKRAGGGDDASVIAGPILAEAVAACARGWRERWGRPPTTYELVHAFEVCLAASPDDAVSDVGTVLALSPGRPAAPPVEPSAFAVQLRDESPYGLPLAEIYLRREGLAGPLLGEVWACFEVVGGTLLVDVHFSEFRRVPSFAAASHLVRALALGPWIEAHGARITEVTLRPMSGLADPVTLRWPPAGGA